MTKKLKQAEFCKAMSLSNGYVKTNIVRGKIVRDAENLIDIDHPTNKQFINYQIASGKTFDINNIFIKNEKSLNKNTESVSIKVQKIKSVKTKSTDKKQEENKINIDQPEDTTGYNLAEQKMQYEVDKLRLDCELKELQKNKIEGALVPVDAIQNIFLWSIDTFHSTYAQEVQSLANLFNSGMSYEATLKNISMALIKLKEDAKNNLLSGIEGVVNEYKEVRGRGEKK